MAGRRRGTSNFLSAIFPEKRLFIQTGGSTRYLRLTPASQLFSGVVGISLVAWLSVVSATAAIDYLGLNPGAPQGVTIRDATQARLDALATERDQRAAEARSAQARFQVAMDQIGRQQTALLQSVEERRELSTALDVMRQRLQDAVSQRDKVTEANDRLMARMDEVSRSLATQGSADLAETLRAVSGALSDAVAARDAARADSADLGRQLADLELSVKVNTQRQDEMVDQLEQAVVMSFGPMEKVFKKADLDVDDLIAKVRSAYSGVGGPLGAAGVVVSTRSFDSPDLNARYDRLMGDLDRMNLLRIAAAKLPLVLPLHNDFRFTSGFGHRHDPKGRGSRMHAGVDLAGPRGTPIFATADGVVVAAGPESGYGNVVRIQHEFGFETVYAHQSRIRVRAGQQVSRGVQIGDMGSTGRSTGSHLHYEVRVNGAPVNPMTYLEAAKDVF